MLALLAGALTGCAPEPASRSAATDDPSPTERARVVFVGDSLTAGLGVRADEAFPAVVESLLEEGGLAAEVINAGVRGDTTAGGLARLPWVLDRKPDLVVLALGGNDGLRGLPLEVTEENLRQIVSRTRDAGCAVLLLGMRVPGSYGAEYASSFQAIYTRVAEEYDVPAVAGFLDGIQGDRALTLADGFHPNADGHRRLARRLLPHLRRTLRDRTERARRAAERDEPAAGPLSTRSWERSEASERPGSRTPLRRRE